MVYFAEERNLAAVCELLVYNGFTSPDKTTNLKNIPRYFVSPGMKKIGLSCGILREHDGEFYVNEDRFNEWKDELNNIFPSP